MHERKKIVTFYSFLVRLLVFYCGDDGMDIGAIIIISGTVIGHTIQEGREEAT